MPNQDYNSLMRSPTIVAVLLLFCLGPVAMGQTSQTEVEAKIAAKIRDLRGRITKNKEGKIDEIILACKDEEFEALDLGALTALKAITIAGKGITNRSVAQLRKIRPGLERLYILLAPVDDRELVAVIQGQSSLQSVHLISTKVTDRTLVELGNLQELMILNLTETPITDAGLKHLAALPQLYSLDVAKTKVSDLGIQQLGALAFLRLLDVRETKVTEAGKKALQQRIPNLVIK